MVMLALPIILPEVKEDGADCRVFVLKAPKTGNWIYWYSFDYGGIHVIQMSTEHNWTRGSEQYEWLQHDLEQVDRSVTPWVVLTAHRMMVRNLTVL